MPNIQSIGLIFLFIAILGIIIGIFYVLKGNSKELKKETKALIKKDQPIQFQWTEILDEQLN